MAISFGPKLGLLYNALINETYYDSLRLFLQSIDQLVNGSVINATQVTPPTSPNPGDAYLLIGGTPGGAWTGQAGKIAFWDAQLTQSGTNNVTPGWVFLTPLAGWIVYNVATTTLSVYNGTSWVAASAGANFPVNTDITQMTALSTTVGNSLTISSASANANDAISITDSIHTSSWSSSGAIICGSVASAGNISCAAIQSSSGLITNVLENATPGTAMSVSQNGGGAIALEIGGTGTIYQSMLGFSSYPTQTTVGAAGGASALPATPLGYLPISVDLGGTQTTVVVPYYAAT
jgi:hypothetical protein